MLHLRSAVLTALAFAPFGAAAVTAQDRAPWPDYRGPGNDGHAPGARLPLTWSESENVRFRVDVPGVGWSSPIVCDGLIWLTSASDDGKEMALYAFDVTTGARKVSHTVFRNAAPEHRNKLNSYASPSPVGEPGRVYVHFGTYGTACFDTDSGERLWERRDLNCDHMEGPGSSPILHEDLLVFNCDGADKQYVVALDKATGRTLWKVDRSVDFGKINGDLRKAFSTPIVIAVDGKPRIVSSGARATMAYDPATGEELWKVRHPGFSMSARPLAADGVLFLNTGFMSAQLVAVRSTGRGDVTDSDVLWSFRRSVPRMASGVLVDGLIYMVSDGGVATCVDAKSGARVWNERFEGGYCASPIYANGRIYFFDREGRTVVIQPGRTFRVLARNRLDSGCMASPAVVGDALILRTKEHIYRIEAPPARPAATAAWSRFRGPNGTGVAATTGLPIEFGPDENVVWKTTLPSGHSSPVLSDRCVFLTAQDDGKLFTYCLARADGRVVWRKEAPRPRRVKLDKRNHPASPTPAVDADTVIVFFEDFGLLAYDHAGTELWRHPLGPFVSEYGMGASPVLLGDRAFLACDQTDNSFLIAVAKKDGKTLWRQERAEAKSGHCTPIIYRPEKGNPQLILPGSFLLDAYDTQTGERIWWVRGLSFEMKSTPVLHEGTIYINGYASPMNQRGSLIEVPEFKATLAAHDRDGDGLIDKGEMPKFRGAGMFFGFVDLDKSGKLDAKDWAFLRAALASENGMLAITAGGHGDMTKKSVRWGYYRSVPQLPSPLLYGDVLYMLQDQGGIVITLKPKTGEVIERGRVKDAIDNYYASPVAGDGKIYLVSEAGLVTVLPIGGSLKPLATHDLGARCYATPAIADGHIYIRTTGTLYCFGKRRHP